MKRFIVAAAALAIAFPALAQTAFTAPAGRQQGQWSGEGRGPGGQEGPGGHDRMFAMMDANHDGVVSRAEFDAFHAHMHEMHRGEHGHGPGGRGGPGGPGGQDGDAPPHN